MKKLLSVFYFSTIFLVCFSQTSKFDMALSAISSDLSDKLKVLNKKKVVVLYITDINKEMTSVGKYLADIISINLVNNPGTFQVFNRDNLNEITETKNLYKDGYISEYNAKELARILSVDAIVIGKYTILSNTMKLTLQALDAINGFVVAASMKDLPLDADAGALLGINISDNNPAGNRGFNSPVKSGENYNNPNTVNKDCENKSTGDYCFINQKNFMIEIHYNKGHRSAFSSDVITIEPGQTSCLYDISSGPWYYYYIDETKKAYSGGYYTGSSVSISGQFLVEKCKSKTVTIK
jgi:hypothetical protein